MKPLLAVFLIPAALFATPGTVLEDGFPRFSSHANVRATAPTSNGGVFLLGDFHEIDGLPRPGIGKLASTGTPDPDFIPAPDALPARAEGVFELPGGRVMVLGMEEWRLLNPDGSRNETLFPDLPREGSPVPLPQFVAEDRVYLIVGDDPELRAYHADELTRDSSFGSVGSKLPPFEAVPAADGGVWVLDHDPTENASLHFTGPFALRRLESDGSLDPGFPRRELAADHRYRLRPAPDGGFRLIREGFQRYRLWPAAPARGFVAETFDASGESSGSLAFSLPFELGLDAVALPGADQAVLPSRDTARLVRAVPEQTPENELAALNGPDAPFVNATDARTVDLLPDGRLLVGGTRRLFASGEPDPSWTEPELAGEPAISGIVPHPSGGVLVHGDFHRLGEHFGTAGLASLSPTGTPDLSFRPNRDGRYLEKIRVAPDGTLVALFDRPVSNAEGARSALARLGGDGRFLHLLPVPPPAGTAILYRGEITDFAIQSDGAVICTTFRGSSVFRSGVHRILPDGAWDPEFRIDDRNGRGPLLVLPDDSFFRGGDRFSATGGFGESVTRAGDPPGTFSNLRPLLRMEDGSILFARPDNSRATRPLYRWRPGSGLDPDFAADLRGTVAGATRAAHGKILIYGELRTNSGAVPLARLSIDGRSDPTFRLPEAARIDAAARVGDALWVAGEFTDFEDPLVRLSDARAVGYDEWIRAAAARSELPASGLDRDADPDGDGSPNFLEYAAASDPVWPDPSHGQPVRSGPLTWRLPCNPEAPEVVRRLETSTDGITWHPASADEVRLDAARTCLAWTLQPGIPTLLVRVRVD